MYDVYIMSFGIMYDGHWVGDDDDGIGREMG